jgi:hypothetical protein
MNDGLADTTAIDLFKAGGKPDNADECDKTLFREAGLLPNSKREQIGAAIRDLCEDEEEVGYITGEFASVAGLSRRIATLRTGETDDIGQALAQAGHLLTELQAAI